MRRQGRYVEAAAELDRALALDPHDLFALSRRASVAMLMAAREQALHTRNALDIDVLEARYRPMLSAFDRVLSEKPDDIWTRCQRVEVLRCMKSHQECLAECRRILRQRPDFAWLHQRMAWAHRWLLEYDDALCSIDAAIRLDPGHGWSRGYRGLLLGMTRRIDEADAEFSALSRAQPLVAAQWNLERGILLLFNGRVECSLPLLSDSLERRDAYLAHYYLAVADAGRSPALLQRAGEAAQRVLATEGAPLGHYMLAGLAALRDDTASATRELGMALPGNDVVLEAAVCDPATRDILLSPALSPVAEAMLAGRPQAKKHLWPRHEAGAES